MGSKGGTDLPPNKYEIAQGGLGKEMYVSTDPQRQKLLADFRNLGAVPPAFAPAMGALGAGYQQQRQNLVPQLASLGGTPSLQNYMQAGGARGMSQQQFNTKSLLSKDILDALERSAYTAAWRAPATATEGFGKLASAASARDMAESAAEAQQEAAAMQAGASLAGALILALALA